MMYYINLLSLNIVIKIMYEYYRGFSQPQKLI